MTYQRYCDECARFNVVNPYNSEQEFNRAYGISEQEQKPLFIEPKSARSKIVQPTLQAHIKISKPKKDKPVKAIKTKQIITEEQRKLNRTKWMREHRALWKEQGLTSKGKPYKVKEDKPEPTTEEIRKKRAEYARKYRENHREKHLAYRREARARKKLNNIS